MTHLWLHPSESSNKPLWLLHTCMKRRHNFKGGYRKIGRLVPLILGFTSLTRNVTAWSLRMATATATTTAQWRRIARATTTAPWQWRQCAASSSSSSTSSGRLSFCCHSQRQRAAMAIASTTLFVAPLCDNDQGLRYRTHCATTRASNNAFSWFNSCAISRTNCRPLAFTRLEFTTLKYNGNSDNEAPDDNDDDWVVPDTIQIPTDQLDVSFVRSSGAGGQNVNKVSSCVQVRFHVKSASWMPLEVRERFASMYRATINKDGVYWTECQENRTQVANRQAVLQKLSRAVRAAWPRPKQRQLRDEGILSEQGKRQRKQDKQFQKLKKEGRRRVDY
jgi:RF-1 domain